MTEVSEDQYGARKMVFSSVKNGKYRNEVEYLVPLPQVCSLCMSPSVYATVRDTDVLHFLGYTPNPEMLSTSVRIEYPLCQACYNLLFHPAVENPGSAYGVTYKVDTSQISIENPMRIGYSPEGMYFVNPEYSELVCKLHE